MKNNIINWLLKKVFYTDYVRSKLFIVCGDIAERFHDKGSGDYDDLQEKLFYWVSIGLSK